MTKLFPRFLFLLLLLSACKSADKTGIVDVSVKEPVKELTQAEKILAQTIAAHGGEKYDRAHYQFVFRGKNYTFRNAGSAYEYTLNYEKEGDQLLYTLNNEGINLKVNGTDKELTEKEQKGYTGSLNSVVYFATLPHKLSDPAVNVDHKGKTTIKGQTYEVLEVTFDEEGGGEDHDDEFYYWINKETKLIDYLAYNYRVNKGGVRFRSAYNPHRVGGILFQDYVNWKAPVGTPLADLPGMFENETLGQLSLIETEDVKEIKD